MASTPAIFKGHYPEFVCPDTYPVSQVQFWLDTAYSLLNVQRWGRQLDMAAELYCAHNLALEARAQASAANGGIPGEAVGILNSKSVDKVSAGYDTGSSTETGAGHWNLTIYGTRLYRFMKMFGSGPIQIGIGQAPPGSGLAWPGPLTTPGFTNFGT
jgi:hypothetical protein